MSEALIIAGLVLFGLAELGLAYWSWKNVKAFRADDRREREEIRKLLEGCLSG